MKDVNRQKDTDSPTENGDGMANGLPQDQRDIDARGTALKDAMRRAFNLGQTYWQQADSEYVSQNKKAEGTLAKYEELVEATLGVLARPAPEALGAAKEELSDEHIMQAMESAGVKFQAVWQARFNADSVMTRGSIDANKIITGVRAILAKSKEQA